MACSLLLFVLKFDKVEKHLLLSMAESRPRRDALGSVRLITQLTVTELIRVIRVIECYSG